MTVKLLQSSVQRDVVSLSAVFKVITATEMPRQIKSLADVEAALQTTFDDY